MTAPVEALQFGRNVLGPIFSEFALRLWLFTKLQPPNARILFCARGGLRLRLLYETFLESAGLQSALPCDDLMVSRLAAVRPALMARAPAALDEIGREFAGQSMRTVAAALAQDDVALSSSWDELVEPGAFDQLLWKDETDSRSLRAAIAEQADLFLAHLEEKSGEADRIILCDTGLYGSTMRLLQAANTRRPLSCIMFARSNYKGFSTEHFPATVGLCVEIDAYSAFDLRSSVLRFWHLVEHVLEPDLQSVRTFSRGDDGRVRANLERPGWRAAVEPAEHEIFAGVLDYVRTLHSHDFAVRIYQDSADAWPALRRLVTRPRAGDLDVLAIGARSRDFGRRDAVQTIATKRLPLSIASLRSSLWREGAVAHAHPAARILLQSGIEFAHGLRAVGRGVRALVHQSSRAGGLLR